MNNPQDPKLDSVEEIKAQTEKTKRSVQETARELLDRLRWGSRSKVEERKRATADHLGTAEAAVRDAVARLRSEDQSAVATPLGRIADTVGDASAFLSSNTAEDLTARAAETVRRYPFSTLSGAFAVGVAVARVVRASAATSSIEHD